MSYFHVKMFRQTVIYAGILLLCMNLNEVNSSIKERGKVGQHVKELSYSERCQDCTLNVSISFLLVQT